LALCRELPLLPRRGARRAGWLSLHLFLPDPADTLEAVRGGVNDKCQGCRGRVPCPPEASLYAGLRVSAGSGQGFAGTSSTCLRRCAKAVKNVKGLGISANRSRALLFAFQ